ncbi:MAG TPA: hypothetical protein VFA54_06635 [Bryobacterales bacterium]|jgi:hypothetical protein|nr:hypothetical protein [Bryobacterales bacterium]
MSKAEFNKAAATAAPGGLFTPAEQSAIDAGVRQIQMGWIKDPKGLIEWRRALYSLYDLLAEMLLAKGMITEQALEEVIPALVSDILVEKRWRLSITAAGVENRDLQHPEQFGRFWFHSGYAVTMKRALIDPIRRWKLRIRPRQAVRRSAGQRPVAFRSPAAVRRARKEEKSAAG